MVMVRARDIATDQSLFWGRYSLNFDHIRRERVLELKSSFRLRTAIFAAIGNTQGNGLT